MRRIAIYGKGGIGKSTTASNISSALSEVGLKVMQIGCDPKADSTRILTHGKIPTVLDALYSKGHPELKDIIFEGDNGILCVECGGPRPGEGCAGRGIIAAFEKIEELKAVEAYKPDVILYDVLGDVVCGGFVMPIRNGYAKDVFVISSGEMMSLYAASNIISAVNTMSYMGYAKFGGIIQNSRGIVNEDAIVNKVAVEMGADVIYRLPRSPVVQSCENADNSVVFGAPQSYMASAYRELSKVILKRTEDIAGKMKLCIQ
ncbi:AAA family ATPase [Methanomassiliicoccus luminyensis]|uniref:AAA family ATPase n=1 Tax=Methanomassiliicoccus luminyensis TaxID=1080712 RepID=UPI0004753930|nr:nitrogenase iron protein NifH [Methanomassiliicoccus luminyensis]